MNLFIILFIVSLLGIAFMIIRKLIPIRKGAVIQEEFSHPFVPDIEKIKHITSVSTRRYGYMAVVGSVRLYVRFGNFLKSNYEIAKSKLKNLRKNRKNGEAESPTGEKEASKFLKMITDYKYKIRHIKTKIEREENKEI